jgi:hypothetical protein
MSDGTLYASSVSTFTTSSYSAVRPCFSVSQAVVAIASWFCFSMASSLPALDEARIRATYDKTDPIT